MLFSSAFCLFAYLALVSTAPTPTQPTPLPGIPAPGVITFHGAAGAQYSLTVFLDNKPIDTSLYISLVRYIIADWPKKILFQFLLYHLIPSMSRRNVPSRLSTTLQLL